MSNKFGIIHSLRWIMEVSKRFSSVDRQGRSAQTSKLASLGIAFGVMTLIVVMSVMNGFQMSFIKAIQEISSFHIQVENVTEDKEKEFISFCNENRHISSVSPFLQAQSFMAGNSGKESASIIRAVDPKIYKEDSGFARELKISYGDFDLEEESSIVLGTGLARNLGVFIGDEVNLLILSGGSDVDLFSGERKFKVTGIFTSGYGEINSSFCFININDGKNYFGKDAKKVYGIKLAKIADDMRIVNSISKAFTDFSVQSWRNYDKTFFGALRIEKNMLLLLVMLIFVVVAINIYNGMRRLVFERRSEIAIFSALGATVQDIKGIFILRGLRTGFIGGFIGALLGLLISINSDFVFNGASKLLYLVQYAFTAIFSRENLYYISENSSYAFYAAIPAQVFFREVMMIFMFGLISPVFACWKASKHILKMTVAEVLRNE